MSTPHLAVLGTEGTPFFKPIIETWSATSVIDPSMLEGDGSAQAAAVLRGCEAMLIWDCPPPRISTALELAPRLRWAHAHVAGVEKFPLGHFKRRNIVLTNSAGVYAQSLAEFVVLGALFFAKDMRRLLRNQREKRWEQFDVDEIRGATVTIVGYGGIGRAIAERFSTMRTRIVGCRSRPVQDSLLDACIHPSELRRVLPETDYLVIAAPLTDETRGMIGEEELALLKPSAVVVNVGRGAVIREEALVAALRSNAIRGAALDVFEEEPLPSEHPFYEMENVLLSPHSADHTRMWLWDAAEFFLEQLKRFAAGRELRNIVNLDRGC